MKTTIYDLEFLSEFARIRPDQFSSAALLALFEHLTEVERESETEMELDVIALCCEWTEYASVQEAAEAYGWKAKESGDDERADTSEREAQEFLADETTVLEFEGGVLVLNF